MYRSSLTEDLVGMKMKSICTDSSDQEKHSVDLHALPSLLSLPDVGPVSMAENHM